jgi:hypothetical protein
MWRLWLLSNSINADGQFHISSVGQNLISFKAASAA